MKAKPDLSRLPLHIRRVNRKWYRNMKTLAWIPAERITDYLPKEETVIEPKQHQEYWWNNL